MTTFYRRITGKNNMEQPMFNRPNNFFNIGHSHFSLHNKSLYYENPKESSINIKKMMITGKLAVLIFCFKKIFFILKTRIPTKEVFHGQF